MSRLSEHEAARRYLQASMASGIADDEAAQAHRETMARLERDHANVRAHALAGARQDFDEPLTRLEHAHQLELRRADGMTEGDVKRTRGELRGSSPRSSSSSSSRSSKRQAVRAGVRAGRTYRQARSGVLAGSGAGDAGSLLLQSIGVAIGLSLLYLALSDKGAGAFSKLLDGVSKLLRAFVSPIDPLNPKAAAAKSIVGEQVGPPSQPGGAVSASPVQRARLNPRFGPAPGIGTPITPTGVAP